MNQPSKQRVKRLEGILSPVVTPFNADYSPNAAKFVKHCQWLLKSGCAGLAVFGTNSEANSLSVPKKELSWRSSSAAASRRHR
jgi:dihydrodipicolinate synthase/N-acetylneuraminate lyase